MSKKNEGPPGGGQVETQRFMRVAEVCEFFSISRATLYRWIAAKRFPSPISLGPNTVAWRQHTILNWEG